MDNWLKPLLFKDGSRLPFRFFPGPMDGVTEGSFLGAMTRRQYVGLWHTPFMRISTGVPHLARVRQHLQPYLATGLPVIAQMMGTHAQRLTQSARRLLECGATCVDLNCACPSPTVLGNHSGGALLKNPDWIRQTLLEIRDACSPRPFSVKIRMGFDSPEEFPMIAKAIREAQPDLVFIHFRTVNELYRPVPNGWKRFERVRDFLPETAWIACGDVTSPEDARTIDGIAHPDGIAVARTLMSQPDILRIIEETCGGRTAPNTAEKIGFLLDIASDSQRHSTANNGFVLRIAKAMFGKEHEIFQALTAENSIDKTIQWLMAYKNR